MDLRQKIQRLIPDDIAFGLAVEQVESGERFDINGERAFPTASVFKVPVMIEVLRQARQDRFNLDDRLELKTHHKTLTTGVLLTLQDGLKPSIRDLMMLMTIVSDNSATTMLMELVGAANITRAMHDLGFTSMSIVLTVHEMFLHAFGVPDQQNVSVDELYRLAQTVEMDYASRTFSCGPENNISSAKDMTHLMVMLRKGEIVDAQASCEMVAIMRNQQHSSRVPR